MSQINFYPKKDKENKQGFCPVIAQLNFSNERLFFPTGIKVKVKHWNPNSQRVKPNLRSEEDNAHVKFNALLDLLQDKAKGIYNDALLKSIPLTREYVREQWIKESSSSKHNFFTAFEEFIESSKSVKAQRTILSYGTSLNFLKAFQDDKKVKLTFETLNHEVFDRIRAYAFIEKGFQDNYFSTLVARLKTFLTWATDRGYNFNQTYRKFKAPEVETAIVCLYEEELFTLYNKLFKSVRLAQVRDIYCFGCFTGLRISDIMDLKREHVRGEEIHKHIIKTKQFLKVPLNKFAGEILKRYEDYPYGPLPKISPQKFNKYIKEACEEAGIDSPVTVQKYSGGKVVEETFPKHKLITSHTAVIGKQQCRTFGN